MKYNTQGQKKCLTTSAFGVQVSSIYSGVLILTLMSGAESWKALNHIKTSDGELYESLSPFCGPRRCASGGGVKTRSRVVCHLNSVISVFFKDTGLMDKYKKIICGVDAALKLSASAPRHPSLALVRQLGGGRDWR
ncbi:hypothetical protein EVAR_9959_1 [Eumeta japonica]|uniref:Uncharacterized protein n=1 Tax=Eumeta variegata TaxID=151549 RepID=A0A4C1TQV1_EUMVA|nr:hypothetical protein EVAR_9959_1 [Eumeta japonica]